MATGTFGTLQLTNSRNYSSTVTERYEERVSDDGGKAIRFRCKVGQERRRRAIPTRRRKATGRVWDERERAREKLKDTSEERTAASLEHRPPPGILGSSIPLH